MAYMKSVLEGYLGEWSTRDFREAILNDQDIMTPMVEVVKEQFPGTLPNPNVRNITKLDVLEYAKHRRPDLFQLYQELGTAAEAWVDKNIHILHQKAGGSS